VTDDRDAVYGTDWMEPDALRSESIKRPLATGIRALRWRGRRALGLSNGVLELVLLEGGGHIASLNFAPGGKSPSVNVLWEAPWKSVEPGSLSDSELKKRYGPDGAGRFLASFTGHALCLDYFGPPSAAQSERGLPLHGEAACLNWKTAGASDQALDPAVKCTVRLPVAGLTFTREIAIPGDQSVAIFQETIRNDRPDGRSFHWVQHATFGPPFLNHGCSRIFVAGQRAITWPHGYEGKSLLKSGEAFTWPLAPREKRGTADISTPFRERGKGFVASVLLDESRAMNYVAVLNWGLGMIAGYCFRGEDFPWVAVWEENCCRTQSPWSGRTQVRGMEFGTTPMPIGKDAMFRTNEVLGKTGWTQIAGKGVRTTRYAAFLAVVPKRWRSIQEITFEKDNIAIRGPGRSELVRIPAKGLEKVVRP
jgi:hypothetical protein